MNKNKGFIGIGLILAIILGIVVISGGAYYLGKSSDTKKEVKTEENNLPNNSEVNQNQPAIDNNQQVNTTTPTTPPVLTDCTSSSTPSIKVLYPNGGEVYTVGQNVTFKWKTCNVPSSVHISAQIIGENSSSESLAFLCEGGGSTWGPECLNDGEQRLETSRPGIFKINISTREGVEVSDMSDNYFTINSSTKLITSCTSDKGNIMTNEKALEIAKSSSCNSVGTFIGEYSCNKNAGGLVDVYMNPTDKPNCSFACRVSIDTGKAEDGWMCTGGSKLPVFPNNFPEGCGFNGELC